MPPFQLSSFEPQHQLRQPSSSHGCNPLVVYTGDQVRQARRLGSMDPQVVIRAVAEHYGVDTQAYRQRRSTAAGRDLAAYLAHRHTTTTLRELAAPFGLNHPDSVSNLIRRAEKQWAQSPKDRKLAVMIAESFTKTENRV